MHDQTITRRKAIKTAGAAAAAAAAFTIVPRHVLGQGCTPPSDQITKGVIGWGNMGKGHPGYTPGPLIAIADCDSKRFDESWPSEAAKISDWRELIARKDIDLVHIATPPHWHALMVLAAAHAGKDIWCEKPFTRTIGEGIKCVEACRRNGTMLRINTWGRATTNSDYGRSGNMQCHDIKKLVRDGRLGTPLTAVIGGQFGHNMKLNDSWNKGQLNPVLSNPPGTLDYDMWLGPRPWKPYAVARSHWDFRGYWDYDGGGMGDMGFHWLDPVLYYLGKDNEYPVRVIPGANNPSQDPEACLPWNRVEIVYADGTKVIFDEEDRETHVLQGPDGYLNPNWESSFGNLQAEVAGMPSISPGETNFLNSIANRTRFCLDEVKAHYTTTAQNLATIAIRLGRELEWDPVKQEVVNDDQANRMIWEPMRAPWTLDGSGV